MQSVAQRILGKEVTPFTGTEERGLSLLESLQAQEPALAPLLQPIGSSAVTSGPSPFSGPPTKPPVVGGGRRRALCVGIDRYPISPLGGCANDAPDPGRPRACHQGHAA